MPSLSRMGALGAALCAAGLATLIAPRAHAAPCNTLANPVYGIGGSAPKPLFARVATQLAAAATPTTLIYQSNGACFGPDAVINGTKMTGTASYWTTAGVETQCDLPITGQTADFGTAGSYVDQCPQTPTLPAGVLDYLGPIQPYAFIVPQTSTQTSISAAAAYFVYGFGQSGQAAPWTDETEIIKRDQNSGAAILVALATGVPVTKLIGVDAKTNANTVTLVSTATNPEAAIGFCSQETAETSLNKINILAYQHYGQSCGYWPSATSTSFDKQNVRNGHYALWAPLHLLANVDGTGKITNAAAAKIIGYFRGDVAQPAGVDVDAASIKSGAVLDCAMEVKRTADMGDLQPYAPAEPCGCYFEKTATGATSCTACSGDADCGASATHCRRGYCEVN